MPFVKFTQSIPDAVDASERAASTVRAIRSQGGDLSMQMIFKLWGDIALMQARWNAAIKDAQAADMNSVNAFLTSIGGSPAGTLIGEINAVNTAASNVAAGMTAYFNGNPKVLVQLFDVTTSDGLTYKDISYTSSIPDPHAQALRSSGALSSLDTALTALGV